MLSSLITNNYSFPDYSSLNDNLLYLDYIRNNYEFKKIAVEPMMAYRNQGNFIGLLNELNVESGLYLFTMYINGIRNPLDFNGKITSLELAIRPPIPSV